jgi:hypothetical protein
MQTLTVTYLGTAGQDSRQEDYNLLPVDLVAFERKFKCGSAVLDEDFHMEHLSWLAWTAGRRLQMIPNNYEVWLPTVERIQDLEAEAEAEAAAPKE